MKKKFILMSTIVLVMFSISMAGAAKYTLDPVPSDLYDLDHYKYYTWGIDWSSHTGETITGASLSFYNIRNYNDQPNDLWVNLLDEGTAGVTIGTDNQGGGNYFNGQGTELLHWDENLLTETAQDLTYNFSKDELIDLTQYSLDGFFALGFDPDCHFYNDGITLTITTHAPIPGAVWLLASGIVGLVGIRRHTWKRKS